MLKPMQCRAGRALVNMLQEELAKSANVSRNTIVDFEKERRVPGPNNLIAIRKALEAAGVVFISDENGVGAILTAAPSTMP